MGEERKSKRGKGCKGRLGRSGEGEGQGEGEGEREGEGEGEGKRSK
jgi:hypothetical protein